MIKLADDDYCLKYAEICDVVYRVYCDWDIDHTDENPWLHTSDNARMAANRIFEILDVDIST